MRRTLQVRGISDEAIGQAGIAATEAANWACAIDERLADTDPGYRSRRNSQAAILLGIRYVRDRMMHQVVVAADADRTPFFNLGNLYISRGIIWRSSEAIGHGDKPHSKVNRARLAAYVQHLEGHHVGGTLGKGRDWLVSELRSRGLPIDDEPFGQQPS